MQLCGRGGFERTRVKLELDGETDRLGYLVSPSKATPRYEAARGGVRPELLLDLAAGQDGRLRLIARPVRAREPRSAEQQRGRGESAGQARSAFLHSMRSSPSERRIALYASFAAASRCC